MSGLVTLSSALGIDERSVVSPMVETFALGGHCEQTLWGMRGVRADVERLETHVVAVMRGRGDSWTEIARFLGISRQAAWKRFKQLG